MTAAAEVKERIKSTFDGVVGGGVGVQQEARTGRGSDRGWSGRQRWREEAGEEVVSRVSRRRMKKPSEGGDRMEMVVMMEEDVMDR